MLINRFSGLAVQRSGHLLFFSRFSCNYTIILYMQSKVMQSPLKLLMLSRRTKLKLRIYPHNKQLANACLSNKEKVSPCATVDALKTLNPIISEYSCVMFCGDAHNSSRCLCEFAPLFIANKKTAYFTFNCLFFL